MRKLQNDDMYLLSEIIDKMDFDLPKFPNVKKEDMESAQKDYGTAIVTMLLKRIHRARNEINQLMANVSGKSIEEVAQMPIKETFETLKHILKQDGVLDFFK